MPHVTGPAVGSDLTGLSVEMEWALRAPGAIGRIIRLSNARIRSPSIWAADGVWRLPFKTPSLPSDAAKLAQLNINQASLRQTKKRNGALANTDTAYKP